MDVEPTALRKLQRIIAVVVCPVAAIVTIGQCLAGVISPVTAAGMTACNVYLAQYHWRRSRGRLAMFLYLFPDEQFDPHTGNTTDWVAIFGLTCFLAVVGKPVFDML